MEVEKTKLQEQLHQAQRLEVVGQAAGGVAHDFSNLLAVISGYAKIARESLSSTEPKVREALRVIEEAVLEGTELTRSLLTFSREISAEKRPIKLNAVVEQSLRMLRRLIPAAIRLEVDTGGPDLWVYGDPTQLKRVVMNLVMNACDAIADRGAVCVSISAVTSSDAGELADFSSPGALFARLKVTDSGMGMSQEVQSRIFEPFFTTKRRGKGTGLGLEIAYRVVANHGGHIEVKSGVGRGSTFTVVLPCILPQSGLDEVTPSSAVSRGRGELILLAEENAHIRALIASTLQSLDYEVLQVDNIPAFRECTIDRCGRIRLFILDLDSPNGTGLQCLRCIRETGLHTPVILITGKVDLDIERKLDGHVKLFRKPYRLLELGSLAGELIGTSVRQKIQA